VRNTSLIATVAALCLVAATPASAQVQDVDPPIARDQVISASPVLWMFKWFNADYERRINSTTTWGLSGSYLPLGDFEYGRASVLVRYYPQRAALTGFYLGGQTGMYRTSEGRQHEVLYGAGMDIGYAWLLGAQQRVGVSIGFGITRVFGGDLDGASIAIPNVRLLNVGIAF
jgi:uncharacterized protein DUF3575